jgi:oxepin-CoA hydrolase / 3-oxo-5,6-dehydrosuberyl-CoA semialdehyde dehydrogenase
VTIIPFDVNDNDLRVAFFEHHLADALAGLTERMRPRWGNMTAQHMVEHLLWSFECSTGELTVPCRAPESILERVKAFLYDNRPTPHGFKNPLLGQVPPALRFASLADALAALDHEAVRFVGHFLEEPGTFHVHPVFGPLGGEEWQRSHFKHCYHHLLQFGLIREPGPEL